MDVCVGVCVGGCTCAGVGVGEGVGDGVGVGEGVGVGTGGVGVGGGDDTEFTITAAVPLKTKLVVARTVASPEESGAVYSPEELTLPTPVGSMLQANVG